MEIERESTRSQCLEKSLWKRLWTCLKTDYRMMKTRYITEVTESDPFTYGHPERSKKNKSKQPQIDSKVDNHTQTNCRLKPLFSQRGLVMA